MENSIHIQAIAMRSNMVLYGDFYSIQHFEHQRIFYIHLEYSQILIPFLFLHLTACLTGEFDSIAAQIEFSTSSSSRNDYYCSRDDYSGSGSGVGSGVGSRGGLALERVKTLIVTPILKRVLDLVLEKAQRVKISAVESLEVGIISLLFLILILILVQLPTYNLILALARFSILYPIRYYNQKYQSSPALTSAYILYPQKSRELTY